MATGIEEPGSSSGPWKGLRRLAALPAWLQAAVRPELVGAALAATVPELASGTPSLRDCRVTRPRLDVDHWTARYLVTVTAPDGTSRLVRLVGNLFPPGKASPGGEPVRARFGSRGWRCQLTELGLDLATEPPDTALPALAQLTDPEQARDLLGCAIRAGTPAYADLRIHTVRPEVIRYHQGSRCTIRYQLGYPQNAANRGWPEVVVAKTYSSELGQHAYDGMRALWRSPLSGGTVVQIAAPLAYIPELRVLIQGLVREEQTLAQRIREALAAGTPAARTVLEADLEQTAAGLAALHDSEVRYGEHVTLHDELAEVRAAIANLAVPVPELADVANPLLARIEELDSAYPADPAVPTHRSFHPAQVLLWRGQIGFIDFDGFCQAEPALDVALFRAAIKYAGPARSRRSRITPGQPVDRAKLAELEQIAEVFSGHYEALMPISRPRVMLWETLNLLTFVLHCWTKIRPHRLGPTMALLEQHLLTSGL